MDTTDLLKRKKKSSKAEKKHKKSKKSKKEISDVAQVTVQEKTVTKLEPKDDVTLANQKPANSSKPWNDWESAKFSDESRKKKFLRLLGSKGSVVGGEQKVVDQVTYEKDMEKQFEVGRKLQFGSVKRSLGLGASQ